MSAHRPTAVLCADTEAGGGRHAPTVTTKGLQLDTAPAAERGDACPSPRQLQIRRQRQSDAGVEPAPATRGHVI